MPIGEGGGGLTFLPNASIVGKIINLGPLVCISSETAALMDPAARSRLDY